MSMSNALETGLLELILKNADLAGIGDAGGLLGSVVPGDLYLSLHTGNPDEGGDQTTNETVYTNYVRIPIARSGAGWTVVGNTGSNAALAQFDQCGATGATITHVGVGTDLAGAGILLFSGQLSSPLAVANLIQPQFEIGDLDITLD